MKSGARRRERWRKQFAVRRRGKGRQPSMVRKRKYPSDDKPRREDHQRGVSTARRLAGDERK